ncbi:MAG: hypothetical protein H6708_32570 [Kofleriaceae bacterium]|nr:hypothetical protein [Kofleriaceae bacterium]
MVEPWLDRVGDLGQVGVVGAAGAGARLPAPRLHSDDGGGFAGVAISTDDPLVAAHADAVAEAARAAGAALAALGHRGPFGVDALVHRVGGAPRLRPLVEINARMTFGLVGHAWAERLGPGTLAIGRGAPPVDAVALLLPGDGAPTAAWFTRAA